MKYKIKMLVCSMEVFYRGTFRNICNAKVRALELVDYKKCSNATVIDSKGKIHYAINCQFFYSNGKTYSRS